MEMKSVSPNQIDLIWLQNYVSCKIQSTMKGKRFFSIFAQTQQNLQHVQNPAGHLLLMHAFTQGSELLTFAVRVTEL